MNIHEYIPTEQLRPYIKAYRIIESSDELVNRVVPGTSFALAFRFRGQISYLNDSDKIVLPVATFSGLRKSVRRINYAPQTSAVIVLFKETGVPAFFRQPIYELFEQSVPLDGFFSHSETSLIEERLAEADSHEQRVEVVEEFLCTKLLYTKTDKLVSEAIAAMYAEKGQVRIKALADHFCISQDAFEKRFRRTTGATPKQFASIVRMKQLVLQNTSSSLLDRALENGYYDQAHFNKAFKVFTGQTPTDFFKSPAFW